MSKGGRGLTDDEKKLWRRVAASVRARRTPTDAPEPEPPLPVKRAASLRQPGPAPSEPAPRAVPSPQDRGGEKRVRRGKLEIGASLDLHGHNQMTGYSALVCFLRAAHARGDRTVIVITGAGRSGQGVLRARLPEWLADPAVRGLVSGFAQAHRTHGGEGAFYVFLRRSGAP